MSPARWAAFLVLERVENTDGHSDDLLHSSLLAGLSQPDKNLATALVMGVLRWQLLLESRLLPLLSRPDAELPSPVATALRLGAFQLLHMDRIPVHAAISESVEMVKAARHPGAAGMVNAILRNLAAGRPEVAEGAVRDPITRRPIHESAAKLAERLGHPEWMVERWVRAYGAAAAEAVCRYDLAEPAGASLFAQRETFEIDDGSRLVAELAAAARPGAQRVWDACAAPGGKTAVLVHRLPGAEVLATDISPKRLGRMTERLNRMLGAGKVRTGLADAAQPAAVEERFDLILCDAPCSGTGTLSRNPEIKTRLEEMDLPRQAKRQRAILNGALERLATGGRLVYSTCSLEAEENEGVVAELEGVRVVPVSEAVERLVGEGRLTVGRDQAQEWMRGPYLRTLPGAGFAGDGFFAAVLERV